MEKEKQQPKESESKIRIKRRKSQVAKARKKAEWIKGGWRQVVNG